MRNRLRIDAIKAGIANGSITESVVLDTYAAYEAMTQERDKLQRQIYEAVEEMPACRRQHLLGAPLLAIVRETVRHMFWQQSRAEAAEATVARLRKLSEEWHAMAKAELYEGGIPGDDGHPARWHAFEIAANELDAALSASSTPDPNRKTTTIMRAADLSAHSGGQDLREVPDTKGSQR